MFIVEKRRETGNEGKRETEKREINKRVIQAIKHNARDV